MLIVIPDMGAINLDNVKTIRIQEKSDATYIFFDDDYVKFSDKSDAMRVFGGIVGSYQQELRVFFISFGVPDLKVGGKFAYS